MNVGMQWKEGTNKWTRRLAAPMLALALVASFVTYECVKATAARAAATAPSACLLYTSANRKQNGSILGG